MKRSAAAAAANYATSSLDRTRLAYYVSSCAAEEKKAPLMLISGWGGMASDWGGLLKVASKDRDVLTFDQRGIGRSDVPSSKSSYSVALMADDAATVAQAAGYQSYDVCGFSLGGLVAQQLTFDKPELVRRLALCSTSGGGDLDLVSEDFFKVMDEYEDPPADGDSSGEKEAKALEARRRRLAATFFVAGLPTHWVEGHVESLKKAVDNFVANDGMRTAAGILGQREALMKFNATQEQLGSITCPTLVMHGDQDPVLDPHCAAKLVSSIPKSSVLLLAGVGHHAYIQEPIEWLTNILEFFDSSR